MPNFLENDLECFCTGPGMGCDICTSPDDPVENTFDLQPAPIPWYSGYKRTPSVKIIKAKWLERVTDNAALFVTKKGSLWIPLAMIESLKRTKKGNYKIEVYSSFTEVYNSQTNHRYFKNAKE
jgi:hypothetical protein